MPVGRRASSSRRNPGERNRNDSIHEMDANIQKAGLITDWLTCIRRVSQVVSRNLIIRTLVTGIHLYNEFIHPIVAPITDIGFVYLVYREITFNLMDHI